MRKLKRNLLAIFLLLNSISFSQDYLGLSQSNYGGQLSLRLNPAEVADSRYRFDMTLIGVSIDAYNNYLYLPGDQIKLKPLEIGDSLFPYYTKPNLRNSASLKANLAIDFGFMFSVNEKIGIGFSVRTRVSTSIKDLNRDLIDLAISDFSEESLYNLYEEDYMHFSAMAWNEYAITYGQVLLDKQDHFVKVGGSAKLLQGITSGYFYTKDASYQFISDSLAVRATGEYSFGYSSVFDDLEVSPSLLTNFGNIGFGLDIGGVYEWRPKHKDYKYDMDGKTNLWRRDKNKYKLKVGFSITDIGAIQYKKGQLSKSFRIVDPVLNINKFGDVGSFEDFNALIDEDEQFETLDNSDKYIMWLPTQLNVYADYNLWKTFYVSGMAKVALSSKLNKKQVTSSSIFVITPRFDHKWVGLSVPLSMSGSRGFDFGVSLRLGPVFVGTSDLGGALGVSKQITGFNVYAGFKLPIPYGKPKDKDGDKVSNKKDLCKKVPGEWAFQGCPDTDGDGIQDKEDVCPKIPGKPEFEGCPDTDDDGIKDEFDKCPLVPGIKAFNGCPDVDGDSITDAEDDCPEIAGIAKFKGCPDTDGDGIKDDLDKCPTEAGLKEHDGCPDTDNDGIIDSLDECPNLEGPKDNNGCPYTDTDGDGVLDKDDNCPETPGEKELQGCPKIEKEEQEIINTAFDNLEFLSGKAIIKSESLSSLDGLAELLVKNPKWMLTLSGHTDNKGNDQNNLLLSKKRAEAVSNYLIIKGALKEQIVVKYYGETQPVADNNTEAGRQKNRRVEMDILFK